MALWQHRHLPVQEISIWSYYYCLLISSSDKPETVWILVPFSNVFCPLVPHYIMPLSNFLPPMVNKKYAIRSVLYPDQCAHEANITSSDGFYPGELRLPCLSIYILAEIFVFKIFTVVMINCKSFDQPDKVSLFRFFSVIKLCSSKLENWPLFIFFQWLVTTNSSNAGVVTIMQTETGHFLSQDNTSNSSILIEVVGMPTVTDSEHLNLQNVSQAQWRLVQSNMSYGFR